MHLVGFSCWFLLSFLGCWGLNLGLNLASNIEVEVRQDLYLRPGPCFFSKQLWVSNGGRDVLQVVLCLSLHTALANRWYVLYVDFSLYPSKKGGNHVHVGRWCA